MTTWREWQEANNRFLAAAIEHVRLLLEVRVEALDAPPPPEPPPPPPPPPPVKPKPAAAPARASTATGHVAWTQRIFGSKGTGARAGSTPPATQVRLLPAGMTDAERKLERATAALAAAEAIDPPPALVDLARRVGLTRFERDVLLLGVACELSSAVAAACAAASRRPEQRFPTAALALTLFESASWDLFSPDRPLRRLRLIEIAPSSGESLIGSPIRVDDRVVSHIKGLSYLDERLAPFVERLPTSGDVGPLAASQTAVADEILRLLAADAAAARSGTPPVAIQLVGIDGASKQLIVQHVAAHHHLPVYRLDADLIPRQSAEADSFVRLWQREMVLAPALLLVDASDREPASDGEAADLARFLRRSGGPVFLATRDRWPRLGQRAPAVEIGTPTPDEQRQAWHAELGADDAASALAEQLSSQFNVDLAAIHGLAASARAAAAAGDAAALPRGLWRSCRRMLRTRLENLAQRIEPVARFEDIVLPPAELELLHQICSQVRNRSRVYEEWGFAARSSRGLGISALFHGESGTGKTMAAEVIANDLDLDLYRIDLSAVVSKYIGETEKNLRRLFDAAEYSGAILFFDEADALFGKRSEVKDSHDRYANIETNYLLQRIESYRGLAILATNFKAAFDTAFFRRLRFMVGFSFPGPAQRREIWQKTFPPQTSLAPLDHDWLSRLNLTGGLIHNVALGAAFLAAEARTPVTMPLIIKSARTELRKLDRPIDEASLRWVGREGNGG